MNEVLSLSQFTEQQLSLYRDRLLSQLTSLNELDESADEASRTVTLDQSRVGRLSRMDALQSQAMALATAMRRSQERKSARAAIKRMDAGHFGECMECHDDINPLRVAHNPAVALCLKCAEASEY